MKKVFKDYLIKFRDMFNDLKEKENRKKQIPNILTLSRLLAPIFIIPCAFIGNYPLCFAFIATFSFTDLLDGYIARKYNLTSDLGKDLDAVADKVFGLTLLTSLISKNPLYFLTLVLESGIAGINVFRKFNNKNPRSDIIGKVKMTVLYVTIALGYGSIYLDIPINLVDYSLILTSILQGVTMGVYINQDKNDEIKKENVEDNTVTVIDEKDERSKELEKEINYYKNLRESFNNDFDYSRQISKTKKYKK